MAFTRAQLVNPNCHVTDSDYDAIESAIMESSRGRWFLAEYARRNRHANTQLLLSAINKVKEAVDSYKTPSRPYLVRTMFSSTYHASQIRKPQAPQRLSQAAPKISNELGGSDIAFRNAISNACRNDSPGDPSLRGAEPMSDAADAFVFNY